MSVFLLIIAALLFISTFGIYSYVWVKSQKNNLAYSPPPLVSMLVWLSGFILPVVSWAMLFDYHWLILFIVNLVVVYILGPTLTKVLLARLASGKGLLRDMTYFFIVGIAALSIGTVLHHKKGFLTNDTTLHTDERYKYEYRTGASEDYTYDYDVTGTDEEGNSVTGNIEMNGKFGTGSLTSEDGDEIEVEVEWVGKGQLEATDDNGDTYDLEVE